MELLDTNLMNFCYNILGMHCGTDLIVKIKYKIDNGTYSNDTLKNEKRIIDSAIKAYESFNK